MIDLNISGKAGSSMKGKRWIAIFMVLVFLCGVAATGLGAAPQGAGEKVEVLIGFHGLPNRGVVEAFGGEVYAEYTLVDVIAARMPRQAAEALSKSPTVKYVEPDGTVYAIGQTVPWGIDRVFGDESYSFTTWNSSKGSGVGVAVLDTGIDLNHEDLTVAGGRRFYIQGFRLRSDNNYNDGHGHGTHVAGTIGALDNDKGVVGVAPAVDLYAVKVLTDSGSGSVSAIIAGIEWVVNQGDIPIINMSLGSSTYSQAFKDACDAADKAGVLVVASAGNNGNSDGTGDTVGYPAKYDSVVAVAASDGNDGRAYFSSTGPAVELIAPGVSIPSTWLNNGYRSASGTSMASPHVAGVAALVWGADSDLTNTDIRTILTNTAQNLGLPPEHQGAGLVRADLAVAEVGEPETVSVTGVTINEEWQELYVDDTLQLTATVEPDNATNKSVIWASSNQAIATVDATGLVTGKSAGTATITVTTEDGGFTATIQITVKDKPTTVPVESVKIDQGNLSIEVGETVKLTATVSPSDATNKSVTWASSNQAIATVDAAGLVTGKSAGTAIITVTTEDGSKTDSIAVTVTAPAAGTLEIVRFDLTNTSNPAWARIEVNWAVTGNELTEVKLEALDSADNALTSKTISLSGSSASGTDELRMRNTAFAKVRITVTDTSDSISQTKDM